MEGQLKIRAYCGQCAKLLMESAPLTKKQLIANWDAAVMGALMIPCEDCGISFRRNGPNYQIVLRIYNTKLKVEKTPEEYFKTKPKHAFKSTEDLANAMVDSLCKKQGLTIDEMKDKCSDIILQERIDELNAADADEKVD